MVGLKLFKYHQLSQSPELCSCAPVQISEEEGRLKKDEEETKEMWKRKREHEEKWEETRDKRVSLQSICRKFEISYLNCDIHACSFLSS